jgi:hypothetical protein
VALLLVGQLSCWSKAGIPVCGRDSFFVLISATFGHSISRTINTVERCFTATAVPLVAFKDLLPCLIY